MSHNTIKKEFIAHPFIMGILLGVLAATTCEFRRVNTNIDTLEATVDSIKVAGLCTCCTVRSNE